MEWKLPDERKKQYDNLLQSTQQLEMTIGSNYCRLAKLVEMRKEYDITLKKWWEEVIKELNIDDKRDYMIGTDGVIRDVTKEPVLTSPSTVPTSKPATVADLK